MAIERPRLIRRIEFAVMVITLMVMATGLGCLMFITAGHAADEPDSDTRKMLARPRGAGRGDQYVILRIVPPPSVSPAGAKLLKEFDKTVKHDPRADVPWR